MRSLIEFPGLNVSSFARTVAFTLGRVIRLMRTMGVSPIASRMLLQIFFAVIVLMVQLSVPARRRMRSADSVIVACPC
jgi:hypothetical protein